MLGVWGILAFAISLGATTARAQNATWVGNTSSDWFDSTNWSNGTLPSSGINATIDTTGTNQHTISDGNATVLQLNVGGGNNSTLTIGSGGILNVD
jgi:hypothetical protein